MKKVFVIMLMLLICSSVSAEQLPVKYHKNMPEGTFKAKRNGDIIHYDKNGKKIGIYRASGRKYKRIK